MGVLLGEDSDDIPLVNLIGRFEAARLGDVLPDLEEKLLWRLHGLVQPNNVPGSHVNQELAARVLFELSHRQPPSARGKEKLKLLMDARAADPACSKIRHSLIDHLGFSLERGADIDQALLLQLLLEERRDALPQDVLSKFRFRLVPES